MKKIIVGEYEFDEAVYPIEVEPSVFEKMRTLQGAARETVRATVSASYSAVAAAFVNGAKWRIVETILNEDGTDAVAEYDKSAYSVAGDIVDHRDGRITVYMAKPTENEIIRAEIDTILPILDDEIAIKVPNLFPSFVAGKAYNADERVSYNGEVYKVLQAHTSQADWTPDVAVSLFAKI